MDILKRYFTCNAARVIQIDWLPRHIVGRPFLKFRGANFAGFYLWRVCVRWRMPWAKVWGWSEQYRTWVPAYQLNEKEGCNG